MRRPCGRLSGSRCSAIEWLAAATAAARAVGVELPLRLAMSGFSSSCPFMGTAICVAPAAGGGGGGSRLAGGGGGSAAARTAASIGLLAACAIAWRSHTVDSRASGEAASLFKQRPHCAHLQRRPLWEPTEHRGQDSEAMLGRPSASPAPASRIELRDTLCAEALLAASTA